MTPISANVTDEQGLIRYCRFHRMQHLAKKQIKSSLEFVTKSSAILWSRSEGRSGGFYHK